MNSIHKIILSILIILIAGFAASESSALHELFKSLDQNKDNKVDRNEFSQDMKENAFHRVDSDSSKEITAAEWEALDNITDIEEHRKIFNKMDKDQDNRIRFFEFSDYADKHANLEEAFMGLDKDNNNYLYQDEITLRPLFKMITIRF